MTNVEETERKAGHVSVLGAYLSSPIAGLAPWILLSLLTGPGRYDLAAWSAFALSLVTVILSRRRGMSVKSLELFDVVFFFLVAVIAYFADAALTDWLELWAGEVSNVVLTIFVLFTIVARRPFTLSYARDTTPKEQQTTPLYFTINYHLTWVWAASFGAQAISGLIGDAVLKDSDNFWTGWVLQYLALVFAVVFTEFYPGYAAAKARKEPAPSPFALIDWLPSFILISGAAGLVLGGVPSVVAWVMLIVGGLLELVVIAVQRRSNALQSK